MAKRVKEKEGRWWRKGLAWEEAKGMGIEEEERQREQVREEESNGKRSQCKKRLKVMETKVNKR